MVKIKLIRRFLIFCVFGGMLVVSGFAQDISVYKSSVSLRALADGTYTPNNVIAEYISGPTNVPVSVKIYSDYIGVNFNNVLMFYLDGYISASGFIFNSKVYRNPSSELGTGAKYYPNTWYSDDIRAASYAVARCYAEQWRAENPNETLLFEELEIPVNIELELPQDFKMNLSVPGIGNIYVNDKVDDGLEFSPIYPNATGSITDIWENIKNPPANRIDLILAAHRGFWGDNNGSGPIENSEAAIKAAAKYTNVMEADIMITKDGVIVASHDYTLDRLTDYNGPNPKNTFIYDLNYDEIKNLYLIRRDGFVDKDSRFITLDNLISYMKKYKTVLTLDVKERAKRLNPITGDCTASCDVESSTRSKDFVTILVKILDAVKKQDAWQYVAVKTTLTWNKIAELLPFEYQDDVHKILFFPVLHIAEVAKATQYIDDWYNTAPSLLIGFQATFKTPKDQILQAFSKNGKSYINILHYINSRTGLRAALYAEEPMGPKGIVDRYAQWKIKDMTKDYRGDPYFLMNIPGFKTAIVTTDRPDIWKQVLSLYPSPRSTMTNNFKESGIMVKDTLGSNINIH